MNIRSRYLIVALLAIPLADAAVLLWVATNLLTAVQTVALVVVTGLLGMLLVRAEGRHTIRAVQRRLASGEVPTGELLDGALLIAAGAFLLTPGLITDAVGFLLAIPPTRYPVREALRRYVVVPYLDKKTGGIYTGGVWTSGFPDADEFGDSARFGGAGASTTRGPAGGSATGSSGTATSGGPGGSRGSTGSTGSSGSADSAADRAGDDEYVDVDFDEVDDDRERERDSER